MRLSISSTSGFKIPLEVTSSHRAKKFLTKWSVIAQASLSRLGGIKMDERARKGILKPLSYKSSMTTEGNQTIDC